MLRKDRGHTDTVEFQVILFQNLLFIPNYWYWYLMLFPMLFPELTSSNIKNTCTSTLAYYQCRYCLCQM
jgi:hypothetical protein